jgi:hypothetical protein
MFKDGDMIKIDGNLGGVYKMEGKAINNGQVTIPNSQSPRTNSQSEEVEEQKIQDSRVKIQNNLPVDTQISPSKELFEVSNTQKPIDAEVITVPISSDKMAEDLALLKEKEKREEDETVEETFDNQNKLAEEVVKIELPRTATKVLLNAKSLDYNELTAPLIPFINSLDGIYGYDLDRLMISQKRHLLAYVEEKMFKEYSSKLSRIIDELADFVKGNQLIVTIGRASVNEFVNLVKGRKYENGIISEDTKGALRYAKNPKFADYTIKIIRRVRNVLNSRNVLLSVAYPQNGSTMIEMKKAITAGGLRRSGSFDIFIEIKTPAELLVFDDILTSEVDAVVLDLPSIAKQLQGVPVDDPRAMYHLDSNEIYKIVENAAIQAKKVGVKLYAFVESNKLLLKKCVEFGVYGVVINTDFIETSKKAIMEEEAKRVLGKR